MDFQGIKDVFNSVTGQRLITCMLMVNPVTAKELQQMILLSLNIFNPFYRIINGIIRPAFDGIRRWWITRENPVQDIPGNQILDLGRKSTAFSFGYP